MALLRSRGPLSSTRRIPSKPLKCVADCTTQSEDSLEAAVGRLADRRWHIGRVASGTTNEFSSNVSSSLISSGYRRPGSTVTAKTSCDGGPGP